MGLLDQILGAALSGQGGKSAGGDPLGGLGGLLSGLAGGQQGGGQQGSGGGNLLVTLLPVVLAMLQNRSGGTGAAGGLGGLLQQFQAAGFGEQAASWVGTSDNIPISGDDLTRALGSDQLAQIAQRAGVSEAEASGGLASLLPELVNQLTPSGQLPPEGEVDDALGGLTRSLGL